MLKTLIIRDIVYTFAAVLTEKSVKKLAELTLLLKGRSADVQVITSHLAGDFFDEPEPCEVRSASVDVAIKVVPRGEWLNLDMAIKGELTIPCDRCLDDMTHRVDTEYHLTVKPGREFDDSVDGVLQVPAHWRELDLSPIVRDTVMLTIPIMHVHTSVDECNSEMIERLEQHRGADTLPDNSKPAADPRWDALNALIKQE